MTKVDAIVREMRANPRSVRFADAVKACSFYFGKPRVSGSHHIFRTPWKDDPRVNIQNRKGFVAPYQVKQILAAIDKVEVMR